MADITDRFPAEISESLLDALPVRDIYNMLEAGIVEGSTPAVKRRLSMTRVLEKITSKPREFIQILVITNSFVSGPNVTEFFSPGCSEGGDHWDIHCCGATYQAAVLLGWMKRNGFVSDNTVQGDGLRQSTTISGSMTQARKAPRVNLISSLSVLDVSACVGYYENKSRCFISGWGGASLDDEVALKASKMGIAKVQDCLESVVYFHSGDYVDAAYEDIAFMRRSASWSYKWSVRSRTPFDNNTVIDQPTLYKEWKETFARCSFKVLAQCKRFDLVVVSGKPAKAIEVKEFASSWKDIRLNPNFGEGLAWVRSAGGSRRSRVAETDDIILKAGLCEALKYETTD